MYLHFTPPALDAIRLDQLARKVPTTIPRPKAPHAEDPFRIRFVPPRQHPAPPIAFRQSA